MGCLDASAVVPGLAPDGDAVVLNINGLSWSGMESSPCNLGGLEWHRIETFFTWVHDRGFNALRVPFAARPLLSAVQPPSCRDRSMLVKYNLRLADLSYLDFLRRVVELAGQHGLLVMLDLHRIEEDATTKPSGSLEEHDATALMQQAWRLLATELCDAARYWNLFAVDLRNEPYSTHWGGRDDGERWDTAAGRLGDLVLGLCPRLLIVVEGVAGSVEHVDPESGDKTYTAAVDGKSDLKNVGTWCAHRRGGAEPRPRMHAHLSHAHLSHAYLSHAHL